MRLSTLRPMAFFVLLAAIASVVACGSSHNGDADGGAGVTGPAFMIGTSSGGGGDSGATCPAGVQCNYQCSGGGMTTSISGKVYDPAGNNPIYNVEVYVPGEALPTLSRGVPTGTAACSCPALFPTQVVTTQTAVDGTFTLSDAPVGDSVPLVIQIGKWRRQYNIKTTACQDNPQPDKSLKLPSTVASSTDSMPDIAVSTGEADTLECLMHRIGLPTSEYVAGAAGTGHVHVFAGGEVNTGGGFAGLFGGGGGGGGGGCVPNAMVGGDVGTAECPGMTGAPASYSSLWDTQADLMPYDIVLLSCEGGETYKANPPALDAYLNAGGRVFASHYHYSWFIGPIGSGQNYAAPTDWGTITKNGKTYSNDLATWTADGLTGDEAPEGSTGAIGGTVVTTLNGTTQTFAKGAALDTWLGEVGALGPGALGAQASMVSSTELPIFQPRYDAQVLATNTPSQPWISFVDPTQNNSKWTMYFSFDTPINATTSTTNELGNSYCGRAVYSDLHVGGNPNTNDSMSPPDGCASGELSQQEKALEFMLFDLSGCVIPDTQAPPTNGVIPQ